MKDRLGRAAFWNRPLKNPTQLRYTRFVTQPGSELKGLFNNYQDEFKGKLRNALKTRYDTDIER
jgi:hypothetical protein